jgi:adenine phosphoribosyltransferase
MAIRKRKGTEKPVPARRSPTLRGAGAAPASAVTHREQPVEIEPLAYLRERVRAVPDFPVAGIVFRDLTPLLSDPRAFSLVVDNLGSRFVGQPLDAVVAIEARGFVFGAALAQRLNLSFVPVRKPGKLPGRVERVSYSLEYGVAQLEIHRDALKRGARVLIVDDVLATGGTAAAAGELVRRRGGKVEAFLFALELANLGGRRALSPTPVLSTLTFE